MTEKKLTYLELAKAVLKEVDHPITYQEIWERGRQNGLAEGVGSTGKTPEATLGARLYMDVKNNKDSEFIILGKNPKRFFLKSRKPEVDETLLDNTETTKGEPKTDKLLEKKLHPLVAHFVYAYPSLNADKEIVTKTIDHRTSKKNKAKNQDKYIEWQHPDMVGFYFPQNWEGVSFELNEMTDNNALKFYSFELKRELDNKNYRESFFQAVSNSSWAHEGYLVAANIMEQDEFRAELGRLSGAFGIGIIEIDIDNIEDSKVLYRANRKPQLDWEFVDKLANVNDDFKTFIGNVKNDFLTKRISKDLYDSAVLDNETIK